VDNVYFWHFGRPNCTDECPSGHDAIEPLCRLMTQSRRIACSLAVRPLTSAINDASVDPTLL
jgi:hypothetical protein